MRRIVRILFVCSSVFILGACGNESLISETTSTEPITTEPTIPSIEEEVSEEVVLTIDDFGEMIVRAGTFWEDWWFMRESFAPEHIDFDELIGMKNRLLPTSGFANLDDIRNHLLQYYTEDWVDEEMSNEFFVFAEYFDILYVNIIRAGFPRPDWMTATHQLIEQDGRRTVVETVVLSGAWQPDLVYPTESVFRFTFIDDRIEYVDRNMIHYVPEEEAAENENASVVGNDYPNERDNPSQLIGTWKNLGAYRYDPSTEAWTFDDQFSGSYTRYYPDGRFVTFRLEAGVHHQPEDLEPNDEGMYVISTGTWMVINDLITFTVDEEVHWTLSYSMEDDALFLVETENPYVKNNYIRVN